LSLSLAAFFAKSTHTCVGAILAFLRHDADVPDSLLHRDKAGTAHAFRWNSHLK
jgi:hypothetical protein